MNANMTIIGGRKSKTALEKTMKGIFIVCGVFAIVAVLVITIYMIYSGAPAMFTIGLKAVSYTHLSSFVTRPSCSSSGWISSPSKISAGTPGSEALSLDHAAL